VFRRFGYFLSINDEARMVRAGLALKHERMTAFAELPRGRRNPNDQYTRAALCSATTNFAEAIAALFLDCGGKRSATPLFLLSFAGLESSALID
jgi:hypothetical protein